MRYPRPNTAQLGVAVLAMGLVVLSSNILVQYTDYLGANFFCT